MGDSFRQFFVVNANHVRMVRCLLAGAFLLLCLSGLLSPKAQAAAFQASYHQLDCRTQACPAKPEPRWTWFAVDTAAVRTLAPDWQLLVDNTRFSKIEVRLTHSGGTLVIQRDQFDLDNNWSMGNNLRFAIPIAGSGISRVEVGFRDMDAPGLMRSIKAMDKADHAEFVQNWTVLVAVVIGILFAAFTYNVFLLTWLHAPFQRWYVVWVAAACCYLLIWSGKILDIFPFMAGPSSARTSFLLVGLLVVSGAAFFFSLIEKDKLPQRLIDIGQAGGILVAITSVLAAFDMVFPAAYTDRMFNFAMVIVTITLTIGCGFAAFRGSRAIWYYLAGWVPALALLGMRIARNFELLPQDDIIDKAGFEALAWEALILSLAIADRFRQLRREADATDSERRTLLRVATTDSLTGLGNRALFQSLLERATPYQGGLDVVAVDIDFLKQTNDMAGHDAGDALIVAVAERLKAAAGPNATISRIGGDEFVILLEGEARQRLDAVRQMIALSAGVPLRHAGYDLTISICAGHAADAAGTADLKAVHKLADLALYRAKAEGRGCWRSYDASMADELDARSQMVREARAGLLAGEFVLHYEPIVDHNRRPIAHEAALRWQHPRLGLLVPAQFAILLRESSLVLSLQQLALDHAMAKAAELQLGAAGVAIAINFVTSQLQGPSAAIAILDELAHRNLPPQALIAEVTEAVAMGGLGSALFECLECLREAGARVALDDFGTGTASLIQMRDVPADLIKIDASFAAALVESDNARQVVQAIIALAHSLGKKVVAQGIESEAQFLLLKQMACDYAQGPLFGLATEFPHEAAA